MDKIYKIEISHRTIIFTIFFLILLQVVWIVRDVVFSLFIAFIIMSALKPAVIYLNKKKIGKSLSAFAIFILFIAIIILLLTQIFPPLISESLSLFKNLPDIVKRLNPALGSYIKLDFLSQYLPNLATNLFTLIGSIFSNVFFVVSTLFFSFYFLIEEDFIKRFALRFFAEKDVDHVAQIFDRIEKRMSSWFWGELTLMTIIGVMTFIGLNLLGVRYSLPLALIAGLLEAVPNIGPVLSAVPAFVVAASQSYFLGLSTIVLYIIVQQIENNLVVPWVMRKMVGINPIITLIALIVGGRIGGVLGVLLAIPITLLLEIVVAEIIRSRSG